jgi:hypothetical protein
MPPEAAHALPTGQPRGEAQPVALGPDVPGVDVAKRVFIGGGVRRTAALPGRVPSRSAISAMTLSDRRITSPEGS